MRKNRSLAVVVLALPLLAGACGSGSGADGEAGPRPVSVTHLESTNTDLIELTPKAAQRLDVQTAPVRADADGSKRIRIPYAAVLYDPDGQTWTYTSPRSRVYTREDIVVDHVAGGTAILKKGPPPGAQVVTVGATELWGVVYGGIHED